MLTTGSPGSKSPASGGPGQPTSSSTSNPEVKTPPTAHNKALQNVKGDHPSNLKDIRTKEGQARVTIADTLRHERTWYKRVEASLTKRLCVENNSTIDLLVSVTRGLCCCYMFHTKLGYKSREGCCNCSECNHLG
ncbi:hypothetical protein J6590_054862 [Homalodisca vitripennis]|nr:hypothetical protein J6590_054862 [Homalodisca vitripennis]